MLATFRGLTRMPRRAVSETAFGPSQVDGHGVRRRAPNLDEAIEELRQITESSNDSVAEAAGIAVQPRRLKPDCRRDAHSPEAGQLGLNSRVTENRSILLLHGVQSSQLTWWRLKEDLQDLGWQVQVADLLGHGSRNAAGPADLTVEDMAQDVLAQVPGPVDVLAGHSLGSVVALTLVGLKQDFCDRVVIEDPPGLAGSLELGDPAAGVEESVRVAQADSAGTVLALLEQNPVWSRRDAEYSVQNRLRLDVERVARFLRTKRWDLQALVQGCPVPVQLLAATQGTTLNDPDRSVLMDRLPTEHVAVIESGHVIHRERPGLWLHHVLRFSDTT